MSALSESLEAAKYGPRHQYCWASGGCCDRVVDEKYLELGLCGPHGKLIVGGR